MPKYLSIEAGMSQIRVADIDQRGKRARVNTCFFIPVPQGTVEDGYIRDTQMVGDLLKAELKAKKLHRKRVIFVVNSSRVASREIRIPFVKANKIQSILEANIADYFPVDPSKYVLSYSILGIDGAEKKPKDAEEDKKKKKEPKERQYHLMAYASPTSIANSYQETAAKAGLRIMRLDYVGNTIYSALRYNYQKGTHISMKIEEKGTLFTIIKDGNLVLQRNLNYGIDQAAETVRLYPVFGKDLDFEESVHVLCTRRCIRESLDVQAEAEEGEDDFLREAKRDVTESLRYLVGNISRIMDYYSSRNNNAQYDSITCCGLGAEVLGLMEFLSAELGQEVQVVRSIHHIMFKGNKDGEGIAPYAALTGVCSSVVDLSEKRREIKKKKEDSINGAILIFLVGVVSGILLAAAGIAGRAYQIALRDNLNQRINEESSVEQVYNAYNTAKSQYQNFQMMYDYTNTPNELLVAFIEEMEEKMPSSITVESFSSTGTQVTFSIRLASKSEAANTLIRLRTFESLSDVSTGALDEQEDGTVSMSVVCTYAVPALADGAE